MFVRNCRQPALQFDPKYGRVPRRENKILQNEQGFAPVVGTEIGNRYLIRWLIFSRRSNSERVLSDRNRRLEVHVRGQPSDRCVSRFETNCFVAAPSIIRPPNSTFPTSEGNNLAALGDPRA
jgi:hypothetical protein